MDFATNFHGPLVCKRQQRQMSVHTIQYIAYSNYSHFYLYMLSLHALSCLLSPTLLSPSILKCCCCCLSISLFGTFARPLINLRRQKAKAEKKRKDRALRGNDCIMPNLFIDYTVHTLYTLFIYDILSALLSYCPTLLYSSFESLPVLSFSLVL